MFESSLKVNTGEGAFAFYSRGVSAITGTARLPTSQLPISPPKAGQALTPPRHAPEFYAGSDL